MRCDIILLFETLSFVLLTSSEQSTFAAVRYQPRIGDDKVFILQ